jgi:hypothetical protein
MRHLILFIVLLGQVSCDNKKLTADSPDKDDSILIVNDAKDTLVHTDISTQTDTITEIEFKGLFKEKLRAKYDIHTDKSLRSNIEKSYDYWNNKMLLVNDTLKRIVVWGYPLSYKETNHQIKLLTTLGEGENHIQIRLFTLDKHYNAVDNSMITSSGGDEGISSWDLGKFENDSTYLIRTFVTGYETDSIEHTINSCLIIHWNGKIERIENCR